MKNYQDYKLNAKEWLFVALKSIFVTGLIAYLFYNSLWLLLIFPLVFLFLYRRALKEGVIRQKEKLSTEFLDVMRVVHTALLAGMSIENAWKEAQKETEQLHGRRSVMYLELVEWNRAIGLSASSEELLMDFAERASIEDISSFAEVFSFAKRTGGNLPAIIEMTVEHMRQKADTEAEISIAVASRKLEQKVMNVIPMGILLYLRVSSGGYLDALYGNLMGIVLMSICLVAYGAAVLLADRIMDIRV